MTRLMTVLLVACLVLFPVFALAEGAAAPTFADGLVALLQGVVFPLLEAAALVLLTLGLRWLGKKFKFDVSARQEAFLRETALSAVAYAEELAARKIKEKAPTISSSQKLDMAVGRVLAASPRLPRDKAEDLIHSALALTRGAGATGEKAL